MRHQARSPKIRGLTILAVLVLVLAAGALAFWRPGASEPSGPAAGRTPPPVLVEVAEIRRGIVADTVEVVGTTRARQSIEVVPAASGRVSEILFEPGQVVRAGQALVRLESALEEANLAEARAGLADLRTQLDRARQLAASRNIAQARLDEIEAAFNAQRARVAAVERRLGDRVVTAPFSGVIGLAEVDVGARVSEGTVIARLDDLSSVELEFMVPEVFFGRVARGQIVEAGKRHRGVGAEHHRGVGAEHHRGVGAEHHRGTVTAVDTRIDAAARAFRVRAELPDTDNTLPAGLFMTAAIRLAERPAALLIPESAVVAEGRSTFAWRIRDSRAQRVEIRLGVRRYGEAELVDGLAEGDRVAVAGLHRLRDGATVTVK